MEYGVQFVVRLTPPIHSEPGRGGARDARTEPGADVATGFVFVVGVRANDVMEGLRSARDALLRCLEWDAEGEGTGVIDGVEMTAVEREDWDDDARRAFIEPGPDGVFYTSGALYFGDDDEEDEEHEGHDDEGDD